MTKRILVADEKPMIRKALGQLWVQTKRNFERNVGRDRLTLQVFRWLKRPVLDG